MDIVAILRKIGVVALFSALFLASRVAAEDVDTTGDLTVMHACDFKNHRNETMHLLQERESGRTLRLRLNRDQEARGLRTGTRVRVRGKVDQSEILLAANEAGIQSLEAGTVAVAGEQRTIVIVVSFSNEPNQCTPTAINNLMFAGTNSVDQLYQEMSFGAVWFTGNVVGPVTINYSNAGPCDYNGWAAAADAAATAAGVDLTQYQHKVYVLPKLNPCSWAGLGTVGGNPSRSWIGVCDLADVYAHELGHSLGMSHSSTDYNNDGTGDCEYCDNSDIMGYSGPGLRQVNAPHKRQMGWVEAGKLNTLTNDATVTLAPLELDATATAHPQVLRIAKPGTNDFYYFSYRRPIGADVNLATRYHNVTSVHRYNDSSGRTYFLGSMNDTESFVDLNGVTVKQVAHDTDSVTLQVTLGPVVTPPSTVPSPESLLATGRKKRVVLTWTTAAAGVSYRVYRDGAFHGTSKKPAYTDRSATPGQMYSYVVTAVNATGEESLPSNAALAATFFPAAKN